MARGFGPVCFIRFGFNLTEEHRIKVTLCILGASLLLPRGRPAPESWNACFKPPKHEQGVTAARFQTRDPPLQAPLSGSNPHQARIVTPCQYLCQEPKRGTSVPECLTEQSRAGASCSRPTELNALLATDSHDNCP